MLVSDGRAQLTDHLGLAYLLMASLVTGLVANSAAESMGLGPGAVLFVTGAVVVLLLLTAVARGGQSDG